MTFPKITCTSQNYKVLDYFIILGSKLGDKGFSGKPKPLFVVLKKKRDKIVLYE